MNTAQRVEQFNEAFDYAKSRGRDTLCEELVDFIEQLRLEAVMESDHYRQAAKIAIQLGVRDASHEELVKVSELVKNFAPTQYLSLQSIPKHLTVLDKDKDVWEFRNGDWRVRANGTWVRLEPEDQDDFGPFTISDELSGEK